MPTHPEVSPGSPTPPRADFNYLDTLWFQISGTLCNLRCTHCFISCSPDNHALEMLDTDRVFDCLEQAKGLGVKEIYFTGGEPFLHPDMIPILERTLLDFPASVLTNGLPLNDERANQLQGLAEHSRYSLELRISLDHYDEEQNDAVRGKGTYHQALAAYRRLYQRGFLPILTVSEIGDYLHPGRVEPAAFQKYVDLLKSMDIQRPRIKIIPVFEMGMLPEPSRPQLLTSAMMKDYDYSLLQCSSSRIVADDGIYACPILVGEKDARMADTLEETLSPCRLYHSACHTCYLTGMTCKNN